ncbi:hypothetical protein BH10BAC3_BH10BAC3_05200 [soil metagenome]
MFSNLLFVITTIIYIAIAVFVLQPIQATGDQLVGRGYIALVLIAAYIISSLLLTISITSRGAFNWVSNDASRRNIIVAVCWFGLVAGVVICTIAKTEFPNGYKSSGAMRLITYPFYFGAAWLPLLMLVPYAILLHPQWHYTISPAVYKIPLVTGCTIGLLLLIAPKIISATGLLNNYKSEEAIQNSLRQIQFETSLTALLALTDKDENEKVRTAALHKIKADKNLEAGLILILEQENPWFFNWLYSFLGENKIEHPERFIEPINNSITRLASTLQYEALGNPWKGEGTYLLLNAEPLFNLLDKQFNDSSAVFKPNILKLQETMNIQPAKRDGDKARFDEALNKYRLTIKNWLGKN